MNFVLRMGLIAAALASPASAEILTLQSSSQTVTFTGLGVNSAGVGTTRISFGSCTFDGTNTTCILSGRYAGLGGGTYKFTLTYQGNGVSPLQTISAGGDLVTFNLLQGTFVFGITPDTGAPVSFQDLFFSLFFDPKTSSCTGVPVCSVGAVGVAQGSTIAGPLNGQFDPTPVISSLLSATGYGGFTAICPGTWVEIYGKNLSVTVRQLWSGADFNGAQAPLALGGTTATVAGKPAYVEFVSPGQVNLNIPSGVPAGLQKVVITTPGGSSIGTSVTVNAVQPGLLAPPATKLNGVQYAVALFPDTTTYVLPPAAITGVPSRRAKPGDIITLYGIGFGTVTPNIDAGLIVQQSNSLSGVQFTLGGSAATLQFAGLVANNIGLYQFNIVVPNIAAGDSVPLTFSLNGASGTQTIFLPISN